MAARVLKIMATSPAGMLAASAARASTEGEPGNEECPHFLGVPGGLPGLPDALSTRKPPIRIWDANYPGMRRPPTGGRALRPSPAAQHTNIVPRRRAAGRARTCEDIVMR